MALDGGSPYIGVWDSAPETPRAEAEPATEPCLSEHGRGLLIVTALARTWGYARTRHPPGKTVWAIVADLP